MGRTNIEIDDDLVFEVMRRFDIRTKRGAVDLALRRLVGVPLTPQFLLELQGIGWGGELETLRSGENPWGE